MTPNEAIENELKWSEEYSRLSEQYGDLEVLKNMMFSENLETLKTARACEIKWNSTPSGIAMTKIYRTMKGLEKQISSMKTFLKHAENEAKNIY